MKKTCVVLCLVLIACVAASAQNARSSAVEHSSSQSAPQSGPVKHVLKNMYNNTCGATCGGVSLVQTFNAIDSVTTVSCPGTSGTCLIQADQSFEAIVATGDGVAICLYVDGALVNGCYWNGGSTGWAYSMYATSQGISVKFGNHTVQTVVYDELGGSTLAYYNFNYNVYKP